MRFIVKLPHRALTRAFIYMFKFPANTCQLFSQNYELLFTLGLLGFIFLCFICSPDNRLT